MNQGSEVGLAARRFLARGWDWCCRSSLGPLSSASVRLRLLACGAQIERGCHFHGSMNLRVLGRLRMEEGVRISSGYRFNPVGAQSKTMLFVGPTGSLTIKRSAGLSNVEIVCLSAITIGEEAMVGGGTRIYDSDFHPINAARRLIPGTHGTTAPVAIGRRAFIGAHVTVLKGVVIGEEAVVGAGSVVTRSIPSGQIWAGVPARFIRDSEFQ